MILLFSASLRYSEDSSINIRGRSLFRVAEATRREMPTNLHCFRVRFRVDLRWSCPTTESRLNLFRCLQTGSVRIWLCRGRSIFQGRGCSASGCAARSRRNVASVLWSNRWTSGGRAYLQVLRQVLVPQYETDRSRWCLFQAFFHILHFNNWLHYIPLI